MGLVLSWLWSQKQVAPEVGFTRDQVAPSAEAAVEPPPEAQVQSVDATVLTVEPEKTHDVCEPETKDAVSEADHTEDKTVTEVTEEPVVEEPALQVSPEAEPATTENASETVEVEKEEETVMVEAEEPQEKTEDAVIIPAPVEEEKKNEAEVEVMAEQIEPEVPAEPLTTTQLCSVPEVPLGATLVPDVNGVTPEASDTMVDDFAVTDSVTAVEETVADSAVAQQEASNLESLLPGELKTETCEMTCQMHLAMESVQLGSMEMSMEKTLNGHIVPEVSI
ncbi:fruit protein pKIWI501-like isoform X2 [Cynoglossus semilaevis]|uniref:fruit protein pKIWI501-like isoform X2 n=1 Tax=Cynoglossus semilaevis TaxID=244447 RepID=UPI000497A577|nr:fruit protein pKIWI501-like isoform X2 [Cynoglossus semilaevis]